MDVSITAESDQLLKPSDFVLKRRKQVIQQTLRALRIILDLGSCIINRQWFLIRIV